MSATQQRDRVFRLAKSSTDEAIKLARKIADGWFRSQALAAVARYSASKSVEIAKEAARAADSCDDAYKRVTVKAWCIVALAESDEPKAAYRMLSDAIKASHTVKPNSSRAETLLLLLQSATYVGQQATEVVLKEFESSNGLDGHWRCDRARKNARRIASGEMKPRPFFF